VSPLNELILVLQLHHTLIVRDAQSISIILKPNLCLPHYWSPNYHSLVELALCVAIVFLPTLSSNALLGPFRYGMLRARIILFSATIVLKPGPMSATVLQEATNFRSACVQLVHQCVLCVPKGKVYGRRKLLHGQVVVTFTNVPRVQYEYEVYFLDICSFACPTPMPTSRVTLSWTDGPIESPGACHPLQILAS
jgi:hypothetical protein